MALRSVVAGRRVPTRTKLDTQVETLAAQVARHGPLNERDAVGWAIRLCKRVEELHRMRVAHGGISADLLYTEATSCTAVGMLGDVREAAIRPSYHSPERIAGQGLSPADDTWAVAVTLYYLLTGTLPFAGVTAAEIRERLESAAPAPLAVFDVGDDDLQRILDRFLERDAAQRTAGIAALRGALEAWYPEQGSKLPPLEDGDDSLTGQDDDDDDDDEEEHVQTVMRDFSEVRAHLRKLQEEKQVPPGPLGSGWAGADPRQRTAIGGFSRDMIQRAPPAAPNPHPPPAPVPQPNDRRVPAQTTPLHASSPVTERGPAMRLDRGAATVPQPAASGRGLAPPRGSGPGVPAPPPSHPRAGPLGAFGSATPGYATPQPPASGPGLRGGPAGGGPAADDFAPPGRPPVFGIEDDDSEDRVATVMLEAGSADLSAAIAEALATADKKPAGASGWPPPAVPGAPVVPGPAAPEAAPLPLGASQPPMMGQPAPVADTLAPSSPMVPEPTVDDMLVGAPPTTAPGGPYPMLSTLASASPVYPASVRVASGSGLRTALVVAIVVLVMVMAAVAVLWLDRTGTIDLGLPGKSPASPAPSGATSASPRSSTGPS
jgi:hypothetical protein